MVASLVGDEAADWLVVVELVDDVADVVAALEVAAVVEVDVVAAVVDCVAVEGVEVDVVVAVVGCAVVDAVDVLAVAVGAVEVEVEVAVELLEAAGVLAWAVGVEPADGVELADGEAVVTVVLPLPLTVALPPPASGHDTEALPSAPTTLWHWFVDSALASACSADWSLSFAAWRAFAAATCCPLDVDVTAPDVVRTVRVVVTTVRRVRVAPPDEGEPTWDLVASLVRTFVICARALSCGRIVTLMVVAGLRAAETASCAFPERPAVVVAASG